MLTNDSPLKGKVLSHIQCAASGLRLGTAIADWDEYRIWAHGDRGICCAYRCLDGDTIAKLKLESETQIFLFDGEWVPDIFDLNDYIFQTHYVLYQATKYLSDSNAMYNIWLGQWKRAGSPALDQIEIA